MYELDPDSALSMLHSLAVTFHKGDFYAEEVGFDGERSLFDLSDEPADIAYEMFVYVRLQCEWIFAGPTRTYLNGGEDPFRQPISLPLPDPDWAVFPTSPPSFPEFLAWFVRQFHHYAELMRDRLGPRRVAHRFSVSPGTLEACRLALGTAGLPLDHDQTLPEQDGEERVLYVVERARLPGLISALAEPVLEAVTVAEAERKADAPDRSYLIAADGAPVTSVAFFPDGSLLATAGAEPVARIWDVTTRRQVTVLRGHTDVVSALAVAPDGTWLATGSRDGTVRIWNRTTWIQHSILRGHHGWVLALAVAPDGTWLATADRDGLLRIWDTSAWNPLPRTRREIGRVSALAVAPDGRWLAAGSKAGKVQILDSATGAPRSTGFGPGGGLSGLAVAPDGLWLAIGRSDGPVEIWDISDTQRELSIPGHRGLENPVAIGYATDGRVLLATTNDRNLVRISNPVDVMLTSEFPGHTDPVNALAFSPGLTLLASASDDGTVRLWDIRSGEPAR
jgi:WD40 repeat protein